MSFFCGDVTFIFRLRHRVSEHASWHAARAGHVRGMRGEGGWRVTGPGEVAQSAARREETGPNLGEAGSFLFEWGGETEDNCLGAGYPLSEFTL